MSAYATVADLVGFGVSSSAIFGNLTLQQQQNALDDANATADSYLAARFKLPLSKWGADLKGKVIAIARFNLLTQRGFAPEGDSALAIVEAKKDAVRWLEGISNGSVNPVVTDAGVAGNTGGPFVEQGVADPQNCGRFVVNAPGKGRGW